MKRILIVLITIIINSPQVFSQSALEWQRTYGGSVNDQVGNWAADYDSPDHNIAVTPDNGFVFCGLANSSNGDLTSNQGFSDLWIVKSDSAGGIEWQKSYGGTGRDLGTSILTTNDNGFVVCGMSDSNDGDIIGNHGNYDIVVFKLDSAGNLVWQRCYGGTLDEESFSISQTSDNGFVVGGWTLSNDGDVTNNHGSRDWWLIKIDSLGNLEWQKTFGGSSEDWASSVKQTPDSGYIMAGWTRSSNGDVTSNHGMTDFWVVKTDASGNLQWEKTYGGSLDDWGTCVINSNNGGYVVTGFASSLNGDVTGVQGIWDYWLLKIDALGNIEWQKTFGGTGSDEAYDVIQTIDNGILITGTSNSIDGDITIPLGDFDYWIVKTDVFGNFLWEMSFGGSSGDWAISAIETNNDGILLSGSASSNNGHVTGNHGAWDLWIVKLTTRFNIVSGTIFIDSNSNTILDSGETIVQHKLIEDSISGRHTFTNSSGIYNLTLINTGNYLVKPSAAIPYYTANPFSHSGSFSVFHQTDSLKDFALSPIPGMNDLGISITPLTAFRPGFYAVYNVTYINKGTTVLTPTIIFYPDSNLTFFSATITPDIITADSIVWYISSLNPFQTGSINVEFVVNSSALIGAEIYSIVTILPITGDEDPDDNIASWKSIITGSFDPNDKQVSRDIIRSDELQDMPYLDYIIRFQNTGTDTAFNITVVDVISPLLDFSTFETTASSHPFNLEWNSSTRVLIFKFDNILLADSNINEPASHGFIHFKIKPVSSLQINDNIENTASIFFDFNAPIVTNTVNTTVVLIQSVDGIQSVNNFLVYPNPTSEFINVKSPEANERINSISILNIVGETVLHFDDLDINIVKLPVKNLLNGIYLVRIETDNGAYSLRLIRN